MRKRRKSVEQLECRVWYEVGSVFLGGIMFARALCEVFAVLLLSGIQVVAAQSPSYRYGYMHISQYGEMAEINLVDPDDPSHIVSSRLFPLSEEWMFSPRFRSVVSPDGRWIASTLFAVDQSRLMIHLLDVLTWESQSIIEGHTVSNGANLLWSPDSRYLAINIRSIEQEDVDLFIYSVEDGKLLNLSDDEANQRDIGWSQDSSRIMTFSHPCTPRESCSDWLEIFDIASGSRRSSIDLSELPLIGTSACRPIMSPDLQSVSLISNCGIGIVISFDFPNDVYVWNLDSGELTQITDYMQGQENIRFQASYSHEWISDQTLLIGINYRFGGTSEQQQLVAYHVENNRLEVLSNSIGSGFHINSIANRLLFRSGQIFTENAGAGQEAQLSLVSLSAFEPIAEDLYTSIHTPLITIPFACESRWRPDGNLIATAVSSRDCTLHMEGITFTAPTSRTSTHYMLSSDEVIPNTYYTSLGWILQ